MTDKKIHHSHNVEEAKNFASREETERRQLKRRNCKVEVRSKPGKRLEANLNVAAISTDRITEYVASGFNLKVEKEPTVD